MRLRYLRCLLFRKKDSRRLILNFLASRNLRVALIGCGKIADQHLHSIHRIANCEVVAVCDRELLMAKQLAERFGIPESFSAVEEMLGLAKPDVVHITTPPQSHYWLANNASKRELMFTWKSLSRSQRQRLSRSLNWPIAAI